MKKNVVGFLKDNKLLTGLYFVFVFLLCATTYVGFSGDVEGDPVKVKSVTPEYDESSSVVVNNNDVTFNDKDQEVKYKVVLENTEGHDLSVSSIDLTTPTESFLSYTIENLKKDDVVAANSTKEVTVSLKTNAIEGWGRNFNDELTANITFAKKVISNNQNVGSPETGDGIVLAVLIAVTSATGLAILIVSKNKFAKYMVLTLMLTPVLTLVKADTTIQLPITIKASFESQNVMKTAKDESGNFRDYWAYREQIKNVYILNELTAIPGYLTENFDVSNDGNGRVRAYLVANPPGSSMFDLYLQADGVIYPNTNASYYFYNMHNLDAINNMGGLDTSNVTNMNSMFASVGSDSFSLDLGDKFDTSNVTDMSNMFDTCGFMSANFTLDLGDKFDTSKVTNMKNMFAGTGTISQNFTLDLGDKFDTSNVTDMRGMFESVGSSYLDLGDKFDTSNVIDMSRMFYCAGSENIDFTLDLGDKFSTTNVTNMGSMFYQTGYVSEVFTLDLGDNFDTSNVTNMSSMFEGTGYESSEFTLDLGDKFDTSKVTNMNSTFKETGISSTKLNFTITIKNPGVTDYYKIFYSVAKNEGTNITVNYTSETEELVVRMIATKDTVSYVVKGALVD